MSRNVYYIIRYNFRNYPFFLIPSQLQRLRQEVLVYSRITSHFCEIYLTPRVGEYPRAFVFENRYIFHDTFRSLIFEDYQIVGLFYILLCLLFLCVCEAFAYRDTDAVVSFSEKIDKITG